MTRQTYHITDMLALDRTALANQRTLLAYIRTSFYFIGLALTIIGIESFSHFRVITIPLFLISALFITIGIITYLREKKKIIHIKKNVMTAED